MIVIFFCPALTIGSPILYHELCRNWNVSAYRNGQVFAIFLRSLFSFAQLLLSGHQCFIMSFEGIGIYQPIEMGRYSLFYNHYLLSPNSYYQVSNALTDAS
jgi:hypothetical protein